jgi:hypothetical protein
MVVCPHGSEPKATSPAYIHIDSGQILTLYPAPMLSWFAPFAPYLPAIDLDVGAFCALEPPTIPGIDAEDIAALITGGRIGAAQVAIEKFLQIAYAYAWYSLCTCKIDTTPSAPTSPSAPSNLPVINPPSVVTQPLVGSCGDYSGGPVTVAYADTASRYVMPSTGTYVGNPPYSLLLPLPTGATYFRFTANNVSSTVGHTTDKISCNIRWVNGAGSVLRIDTPGDVVTGGSMSMSNSIPAGAVAFFCNASVGAGSSYTQQVTARAELFCGTTPGQTQAPCCPPDPILMAKLNGLIEMVTLIQRQSSPYAYVPGTVHTGLSGDGSFTVFGLVGMALDITTLPSNYSATDGTPVHRNRLGWLRMGTVDGWTDAREIDTDPLIWLPPAASAYTLIGYTLAPGVIATLKELKAEP